MKFLLAGLVVLVLLLQYRMWLGDGGMREVARLRNEITQQRDENTSLRERNRTLAAEVQDLKKGTTAIEERARTDLGMVGQGETFYQVVIPRDAVAAGTEGKASGKPAAKPDPARSGSDRRVAEAGKK
jgi:cell division protein FtsB